MKCDLIKSTYCKIQESHQKHYFTDYLAERISFWVSQGLFSFLDIMTLDTFSKLIHILPHVSSAVHLVWESFDRLICFQFALHRSPSACRAHGHVWSMRSEVHQLRSCLGRPGTDRMIRRVISGTTPGGILQLVAVEVFIFWIFCFSWG